MGQSKRTSSRPLIYLIVLGTGVFGASMVRYHVLNDHHNPIAYAAGAVWAAIFIGLGWLEHRRLQAGKFRRRSRTDALILVGAAVIALVVNLLIAAYYVLDR